jgi:hypothetical protein
MDRRSAAQCEVARAIGITGEEMKDEKRAAERMRFEAVYAFPSRLPVDRTVSNERYCSMETEHAFRAWQAALSARADGGKGEAVRFQSPLDGRWITTPQAECAPREAQPELTVWYGSLPESNGKTNWTAILHRGDVTKGITIDMSEYPDRTRYEADRMRWMIGELADEPWVLDYDADKHSGYAAPTPERADAEKESGK